MHIRVLIVLLLSTQQILAQEHTHAHQAEKASNHFRVSVVMLHTILPESTVDGREVLVLPSFGLDLEYWFDHTIGVGLHSDLELLNFEIENEQGIDIERSFPVLLTLDVLWKPVDKLVLYAGPGIELEQSENFFVFRLGVEYEIITFRHWDVGPMAFYDFRKDAYNTFSFGLGIGYRFGG